MNRIPLALLAALVALSSATAQQGQTFGTVKIPWPGPDKKYNYVHQGPTPFTLVWRDFKAKQNEAAPEFFMLAPDVRNEDPDITLPPGAYGFEDFFEMLLESGGLAYWYNTRNEPEPPQVTLYMRKSTENATIDLGSQSLGDLQARVGEAFPVVLRELTGDEKKVFIEGPPGFASHVEIIARGGGNAPSGGPPKSAVETAAAAAAAAAAAEGEEIDVWVFPLRYAWARDIELPIWLEGQQTLKIPGVASILRDVFPPPAAEGGAGARIQGTSFAAGLGFLGAAPAAGTSTGNRPVGAVGAAPPSGVGGDTMLRLNEDVLGSDQRVGGLRGSGLASNRIRAQRLSGLSLPTNVIVVTPGQGGGGGDPDRRGMIDPADKEKSITVSSDGKWQETIFADPRNNSVIVAGKKSRHEMYKKLISELDKPRDLIEISVSIIDINVGTGLTWGVDYLAAGATEINRAASFFGGSFDSTDALNGLIDGDDALDSSTVEGRGLVGSALLIGDNASLFARVRALEEENLAQVLSRPSVLALDNGDAVIDDETTFHVRVEGNEEVDLFPVPVKTRLRVNPHVFKNSRGETRIRLDVYIKDGAIIGRAPAAGDEDARSDIPVVSESKVSTEAVLRPNQSLMVGGRYRNEQSHAEGRIPLIGRIPVLGLAFKNKVVQSQTLQRVFIITPKILGSVPPPGAEDSPVGSK